MTHIDGVPVAGDTSIFNASPNARVFTVRGVPTKHLKAMTYQTRGMLGMEPEYRQPSGGRERFRKPLNMHHAVDALRPRCERYNELYNFIHVLRGLALLTPSHPSPLSTNPDD